MLVFNTKLPLKNNVTQEMCVKAFIDWVICDARYSINEVSYNAASMEDFQLEYLNNKLTICHYKAVNIELTACRLENRENELVWYNDYIYLNQSGTKHLLIQLNCTRLNYNTNMPYIHKPYIVRKIVEAGYCADDAELPVCDTPIVVSDDNTALCSKVMCSQSDNVMPVVYVSYDGEKNVVSPSYLARQLSGVAHVFKETSTDISFKLRNMTNCRNAHSGYVGIYFPQEMYYELFCISNHRDYKDMSHKIIDCVWKALIGRADSSQYDWDHIMALQSRQKMLAWQNLSISNQEELNRYISFFDSENAALRKKIDTLNRQNSDLHSQLDLMRAAIQDKSNGILHSGKERDLYPGEQNDMLINLLQQAQGQYDNESRVCHLIKSLLEANTTVGECERILGTLKTIFSGDIRLNSTKKAQLKALGFTIDEDGGHYKLTFHDPRYMFTVSKSPSDFREGKNLYSDICRILNVYKK